MIIYDADDPLVLNGTYDREGFKAGERERILKATQHREEFEMKKKSATKRGRAKATVKPKTKKLTHRITTHKPNGAASMEVAPVEERVTIGEAMRGNNILDSPGESL